MYSVKSATQITDGPDHESLLPIQLHGALYYAYKKAVGWRIFNAAYRPERSGIHTKALWTLTAILFIVPFSSFLGSLGITIVATCILFAAYYFLADYAIKRGLEFEYKKYAIAEVDKMQPRRLVRDLMHYHWFQEKIRATFKPTRQQIEKCIEFVDSNKKISITNTFSRHPMVVLAVGIPAFALNNKTPQLFEKIGNFGLTFAVICYCVALPLYVAWIFHSSLYDGERDDWRFKRYLTWFLLQEFPEVKAEADDL